MSANQANAKLTSPEARQLPPHRQLALVPTAPVPAPVPVPVRRRCGRWSRGGAAPRRRRRSMTAPAPRQRSCA
ncbi:MAG: hypothetical protein R2690_18665 [Acidimicrobiales bacterium]